MFSFPDAILFPVAGHLLLIFFLFIMVTIKRSQAVTSGVMKLNDFADKKNEPEQSRRWVNNLNNQFEIPVLFYAIVAMLYAVDATNWKYVLLAYLFLWGRVWHTWVQVSDDNIELRGRVFILNFASVFAMWGLFFYERLIA